MSCSLGLALAITTIDVRVRGVMRELATREQRSCCCILKRL